jgi:hypothetical protein
VRPFIGSVDAATANGDVRVGDPVDITFETRITVHDHHAVGAVDIPAHGLFPEIRHAVVVSVQGFGETVLHDVSDTTSVPAESICSYAKAKYTASTRQDGCTFFTGQAFWNLAMLYDNGMTVASAFPELAHEMHGTSLH